MRAEAGLPAPSGFCRSAALHAPFRNPKSSPKKAFLFMRMDPTYLVVKPDLNLYQAIQALYFT